MNIYQLNETLPKAKILLFQKRGVPCGKKVTKKMTILEAILKELEKKKPSSAN